MTDFCGEPTTKDHPCKWNESENGPCPWHSDEKGDTDANTRKTELEYHPEVKDIVVGCLQAGDTIPEACAEATISPDQYHEWRKRGRKDDAKEIFSDFNDETWRARKTASKQDRSRLKEFCFDQGDARTLYKIHMNQYGDTYEEEGAEPDTAEITVTSEVVEVTDGPEAT